MDHSKDRQTGNHQKIMKRASQEQQKISFKNIKDLAPSGILGIYLKWYKTIDDISFKNMQDFQFFQKAEKDGQIEVKYDEINKIFQNIENTKRNNTGTQEYQAYRYDNDYNTKLKLTDLKHRIGVLNPNYPVNDLNTLFQGRQDITSKDMYELLKDNEMLEDFDPMEEALSLFSDEKGEIDIDKISSLMNQLGYGELDKKDKEILKECLDVDKDNKITDKDFKEIANYINKKKYLL